jgi:class 3 adenylate cyclase
MRVGPGVGSRESRRADGGGTPWPGAASLRVVLRDRFLPFLQGLFEAPARPRREPPRDPLDASLAEFLEHVRIGWHAHHLHLNGPVGAGTQFGDAVVHLGVVVGEPGVAEPKHAIEHGRAGAANEDWWVWPLRRLGPRPDPVEVDIFAVVAGLVMGPDLFHGLDPLSHDGHPDARVGAMVPHFGPIPPRTHSELQAAAREVVDARNLFRRDDRVTFDDQANAAGDADIASRRRRSGERNKKVVRAPVLGRQRLSGRAVGLRSRDMSVLSEVDGAVAALFGYPRNLAGPHTVVGGKVSETKFHTPDLPDAPAFHPARHDFSGVDLLATRTTTSAAGAQRISTAKDPRTAGNVPAGTSLLSFLVCSSVDKIAKRPGTRPRRIAVARRENLRHARRVPFFMDRHEFVGLSAEEAAIAHVKDMKVQGRYGVRFLTYWFDEERQTAFCLAVAPSADAVEEVHRASHGFMAYQIIEVDEPTVVRFMGGILEHPPGEVYVEAAFRAILFTDIVESTSLTQRLGDAGAMAMVRTHDEIVRGSLERHQGSEVKHTGDGLMAAFPSVVSAIKCAVDIQRLIAEAEGSSGMPVRIRIGMAAGEPVAERNDLFGATVQLAARLCSRADPGGILVASAVHDLALGKGFAFRSRGRLRLKGFDSPMAAFEVVWQPS